MTLYSDLRLGGVERLSIGEPEDWRMRIPDEILESVCFLGVQVTIGGVEQFKYGGTGFFVSVPSEVEGISYIYLVTARHCVRNAEPYGALFVRVNQRQGGFKILKVDVPWYFPENESSDVAVLPWAPDSKLIRYKTIPVAMLLTDPMVAEHGIGPGDDLFMSGLFTEHYGRQMNLPIVRTGVIAAMPNEPLEDVETGLNYPAYIAEARSIGGLSGSPVFVNLGVGRVHNNELNLHTQRFFLLGLVRGHWNYKYQGPVLAFSKDELENINMGMALVVPSQDVLAVINSEALVKKRKEILTRELKGRAPVNDTEYVEEPMFTKDDFEQALKKVAKKLPDSGSAQTSDDH